MNILVSINRHYLEQLQVLLYSLSFSNPNVLFHIYIMHRDLKEEDILSLEQKFQNFQIHSIFIHDQEINSLPVYEKRYPVEIYFRIFASYYLPKDIDRVLYLDTDIVVINSLNDFYHMNFQGKYFIATSNIKKAIHKFHEIRLGIEKEDVYINTGVLLMNLKLLRELPIKEEVRAFVSKNKRKLMLPDQDILSGLYGSHVLLVDSIYYNLGERGYRLYNLRNKKNIHLDWVKENTVIIHYYGRNKPWKLNYKGELNYFYQEVLEKIKDKQVM